MGQNGEKSGSGQNGKATNIWSLNKNAKNLALGSQPTACNFTSNIPGSNPGCPTKDI